MPDSSSAPDRQTGFSLAQVAWNNLGRFIFPLTFGLAYTQAPLYYSNQNQYFLHGLAWAAHGQLKDDWLAKTADPTPVFSAIVCATSRHLHENVFYLYYFLILGLYARSMLGIFDYLTEGKAGAFGRIVFMTTLVAIHAGIFRILSARALGVDYPWYFQSGLAAQYVLGFGLQPSVAGVFLIASILAFLRDRPFVAAVWVGLAAVIHPTYLLGSAMLTITYMFVLFRDRRGWRAITLGAFTLLIVSPVVANSFYRFGPTNPETFSEAQRLLAHFRIPHHTSPKIWFDKIALLQVIWGVAAIIAVRRTRLFPILAGVFGMSLVLTLVQLAIRNDTLALLFPWRVSAILVPLATTIIASKCLQRIRWQQFQSNGRLQIGVGMACVAIMAALAISGPAATFGGWGYATTPEELPLLDFIKANVRQGDVYLLPVELKKPSRTVGAVSLNFTPPVRNTDPSSPLAVDLQRFRLYTGAPIFVDFKAIAYKDVEVLEWYRRLQWADAACRSHNWDEGNTLAEAMERGITHIVAATDRDIHSRRFTLIYQDQYYRVYRLPVKEAVTP
jgi:hypothetical protein